MITLLVSVPLHSHAPTPVFSFPFVQSDPDFLVFFMLHIYYPLKMSFFFSVCGDQSM